MLSPNKNFKLSKQSKIHFAKWWDHPERGALRRALIEAEIAATLQPPRAKKSEQGKNEDAGS
jgi:hypothetical protein